MDTDPTEQPDPPQNPVAIRGRIPAADLPSLLDRYRHGEHLKDLAAIYGVSKQALEQRLDRFCLSGKGDVTMYEAVTDYLTDRLCTAFEDEVEAEQRGNLAIARTRNSSGNWKWVNERRRPKLYGPKQEVTMDTSITVVIAPVIPPVVSAPSIIAVDSQVIDSTTNDRPE